MGNEHNSVNEKMVIKDEKIKNKDNGHVPVVTHAPPPSF